MTRQDHYQEHNEQKGEEYRMELNEELFARHQPLMYDQHYVRPEIGILLQNFLPKHQQSSPYLHPPIANQE